MKGFTDEEWGKLKKSKTPEVIRLVSMWEQVFSNPAYDMYVTSKIQTDKWNEEIKTVPVSLKSTDGGINKEFEYCFKYLLQIQEMAFTQRGLLEMLLPEEVAGAEAELVEHQGRLEEITAELYKKSKEK